MFSSPPAAAAAAAAESDRFFLSFVAFLCCCRESGKRKSTSNCLQAFERGREEVCKTATKKKSSRIVFSLLLDRVSGIKDVFSQTEFARKISVAGGNASHRHQRPQNHYLLPSPLILQPTSIPSLVSTSIHSFIHSTDSTVSATNNGYLRIVFEVGLREERKELGSDPKSEAVKVRKSIRALDSANKRIGSVKCGGHGREKKKMGEDAAPTLSCVRSRGSMPSLLLLPFS